MSTGCTIGSPTAAESLRAIAWLLLRMYRLLPRDTSAPSVPPQHKVWPLTVEESFAFPPETPSGELAPCAFCCGGTIVTNTESIAVMSACEIAVTTTWLVCPLLFPLASTGTEFGALNSPLVEITPVCGPPPVTPFTCHVTAIFRLPVTVATNCVDPNVGTAFEPPVIDTLVAGPA